MIEININKIVKNYGFNNVLDGISLDIHKGEIVSLVGANASGKSTLLKLIAKDEVPTSGTISIRNGSTIGFLKQIPEVMDDDLIVKDLLYSSVKDILNLEEELNSYQLKMEKSTGSELSKLLRKYGNITEKFESLGGYEVSSKVGKIVSVFNIEKLMDKKFNVLSGGEKTIVMLANLIVSNPDILLLDEPTNHLDIKTLEWLEDYLKNYNGTIVIVSHDRYFLNRISNKTILIEKGHEEIFHGNYDYYLEENEKRLMLEFKNYKDQQKQIKAIKEAIKKLRDWGRIGDNELFFKRANSMEKRLEKMEKFDKPSAKLSLPISFNMNERSGNEVLNIKDLNISYDKPIFINANLLIRFKEHVCLMGDNGSGKTTLIKAILNNNPSVKLGTGLKIGYIEQEIHFEDESISILEEAKKYFFDEEQLLRSALYKFMFYGENVYKKLSKLSGGEKVRLKLFCLIQDNINFLILDEPTNHIDIMTREILENALNDYNGTILFISHDRYFINKVANRIILIEGNILKDYIGNYDDYLLQRKR